MEIYVKESLFASDPTQGKSVRPTVEEPVHNDGYGQCQTTSYSLNHKTGRVYNSVNGTYTDS